MSDTGVSLTWMSTKGMSLGITTLEPAEAFEDLVAFFQASLGDAVFEFFQPFGEGPALAAAHGTFLVAACFAAGQEIMHLATLEKFDFDFRVIGQALPAAAFFEGRLELGQRSSARG